MTMPAFDTLEAARELEAAGASQKLAEAVVKTFGAAINENVATKGDIVGLKADLKNVKIDIKSIKSDIRNAKIELNARIDGLAKDIEGLAKEMEVMRRTIKTDIKESQDSAVNSMKKTVYVGVGALAGFLTILEFIR